MNVTVPALFICDATNMREGMLSALGIGISDIWRDSYPAPLFADLGLLLQLQDLDRDDEIDIVVRVTHEDGAHSGIDDMTLNLAPAENQPQENPPRTITMPVQLGARELMIDRPGEYLVRVECEGRLLNSFSFKAHLNAPN